MVRIACLRSGPEGGARTPTDANICYNSFVKDEIVRKGGEWEEHIGEGLTFERSEHNEGVIA